MRGDKTSLLLWGVLNDTVREVKNKIRIKRY